MKKLRINTIAGIIFVSALGTFLHFAYELSGNNVIVGIFTPINESVFEHIKLLFFPMLIYSLYSIIKLKKEYPCIGSALALGTLSGSILIPVLFYTYSGVLGFNIAALDILTFYISVITAFLISYKSTRLCKAFKHRTLLAFLIAIEFIAFVIFTFLPLNISFFISP